MAAPQFHEQYVACLSERGNAGSVIKGRLYLVVKPIAGDRPQDLRVVDESGEAYPYPRDWFMELELSRPVLDALAA